jgi:autotransporter-associated beta strand protein
MKKNFTLTKQVFEIRLSVIGLLFAAVFMASNVKAQTPLLSESFNYAGVGLDVATANWTAHATAGSNAVPLTTGNLGVAGYLMSNNVGSCITLTGGSGSREDVNAGFTSQTAGTTVYSSMVINFSAATTAVSQYFASLTETNGATIGTDVCRVYPFLSGNNLKFQLARVQANNGSTAAGNYVRGRNYLLVTSYTMVAGVNNDVARMWILDAATATEPTADVTIATGTGTEPTSLSGIALSQINNSGTLRLDGIRVGTSWTDVVGQWFYSGAAGDLSLNTTYGANTDGTGANPASITENNTVYVVANRASETISTSSYGISGTNSISYFSNNGSPMAIDITGGVTPSYVINADANSTLTINNTNASPNLVSGGTVVFQTNSAHSYSGNTFGNYTLTKQGSEVLTITASQNRFGVTNINSGQITFTNDLQLGVAPQSAQTGWININEGRLNANATISLSTNRGIALGSSAGIGRGFISAGNGFTFTIPSIIANNGVGADSLVVLGSGGIVALTGTSNTYSGGIRIQSGTFRPSAIGSLGTMPGAETNHIFIENGGVLSHGGTVSITIPANANIVIGNGLGANSGTIAINNTGSFTINSYIKSWESTRDSLTLTRTASTGIITINASGKAGVNPSPVAGIRAVSGAPTITETNQFDNLTDIRVSGATVTLASAFSPRTVLLASGSIIGGQIIAPVNDIELRTGIFTNGVTGSINIIKTTTGSLTLNVSASNSNLFAGTLSILNGGTITYTSGNSFFDDANGELSVTAGVFTLTNASGLETLEKITLIGGTINNTASTFSGWLPTAESDLRNGTFSGRFAGNQTISKTTAGTIILDYLAPCLACSTQSDFTGLINVNAGVLRISNEYALGARNVTPVNQLHVAGGGTIRFDASMYLNENRVVSFGDAGSVGTANFLVQTVSHTVKIASSVRDRSEGGLNPDIFNVNGSGTLQFNGLFDSTMVLNRASGSIVIDSVDAQYVGSLTGTQSLNINVNHFLGCRTGFNIANNSTINGGKVVIMTAGSVTWPTGTTTILGTGGIGIRNNTTLNTGATLVINGQFETELGSTVNINGRTLRTNGGLVNSGSLVGNGTSALQLQLPAGTTTLANLTASPLGTLSILASSLGTLDVNQALNASTITVVSGTVNFNDPITGVTTFTITGGTTTLNGIGNTITTANLSGGTGVIVNIAGSSSFTSLTFNDVTLNLSANTSTTNLTLTAGSFNPSGFLTINGGGTITRVAGSLTTVPTFIGSSNMTYGNGSALNITTGNELAPTIANITVNTNGVVTLAATRSITGTFTFTLGKLLIFHNQKLTIPAINTISGVTNARYFVVYKTSRLVRTGVSTTARLFPVGNGALYTPLNISNATSSTIEVGGRDTVSKFEDDTPANFLSDVVDQTWYIDMTSGTPNATVQFGWQTASQLGVFNPAGILRAYRYNGSNWGAGNVATIMGSPISGTNFSAQTTGVTTFSPWAIGNDGGPLPVELTKFTGTLTKGIASLIWQTSSELNNKGFEVELSNNGNDFRKVGFVKGAGTTNQIQNYTFDCLVNQAIVYFRLRQLDVDGKFNYSPVIALRQVNAQTASISPNPSYSDIKLSLTGYDSEKLQTVITNLLGQPVAVINGLPEQVEAEFGQVAKALKVGTYNITITGSSQAKTIRFIKK